MIDNNISPTLQNNNQETQNKLNTIQNTKPKNEQKVNSQEKLWGMVSYFPMVALLTLLLKPDSSFVRLHGRQGLLIFGIFFFSIFLYLIPFIGGLLGMLAHLLLFVIAVYSMYQAINGNWWKIPILGSLADQIPVEMFTKITKEAMNRDKKVVEENVINEEVAIQSENVSDNKTEQPSNQDSTQKNEQNHISTSTPSPSSSSQSSLPPSSSPPQV